MTDILKRLKAIQIPELLHEVYVGVLDELPRLTCSIETSPVSKSQYLFLSNSTKGTCVRVSDHHKEMHPKHIRMTTKRFHIKEFYLYTDNTVRRPHGRYYNNYEINYLIRDIVAYLKE